MLSTCFNRFLRDESGAYAVWSLLWFSLYVAMGGLAVDMTDAYRNQTLLQATADASALAGVMSLPNEADAVTMALAYSSSNMDPAINGNGNVLLAPDVIVGNWNFDTRKFSTGGGSPATVDAVFVTTRRSNANDNALATNFLRIMNLWGIPGDVWNINTEAIAVKYHPGCLRGGFVAANKVDITSGNYFYNDICVHGQNMIPDSGPDLSIDLNNGNKYQRRACKDGEPRPCGVQVSTPDYDFINDRPNLYDKNEGLAESLTEGDVYPTDALKNGVQKIIDGLTDPESGHMPEYITETNVDGSPIITPIDNNYPGTGDQSYVAGNVYVATCKSNKPLSLPTGQTIRDVVIISECAIKASSGLILENVVLASTSVGNGKDPLAAKAVNLAAAARLGAETFCTDGDGGVELYTLASAQVAGQLGVNGLRAVVGGDFQVAAQSNFLGVSVQAGNDIRFPAAGSKGGTFGLCLNGTIPPGKFAWQYRLVY
jgi:hypothetical protein